MTKKPKKPKKSTAYHWLVTLQWAIENPNSVAVTGNHITIQDNKTATKTLEGVIEITSTRQKAILEITEYARQEMGAPSGDIAVLFLSLEPNEI